MSNLVIPQGYKAPLPNYELQRAIAFIKESFQTNLSNALNLRRVSAPLFVASDSGLNDNLNGTERPVSFDIPGVGQGRRGGPLSGQVEASGPEALRLPRGQGPVHRYERHPPG